MYRLEWKQIAEDDLAGIIDHIAEDSPANAEHFAAKLRAKVAKLREQPELYRTGRRPGTRELVAHPNYIVIFRILGSTVEILRIKHAARK